MKKNYSKLLAVVLTLAMIFSSLATFTMVASAEAATYTVEMDFNISHNAAGISFGATDSGNFYMWQINVENGLKLRPHRWVNNGGACLSEIPISTDVISIGTGEWHKARYEISGNIVKTYIDDTLIDTYTAPDNIPLARLGFRQNGNEKAYYDNIKVIVDGETTFFEDFSDAENFKFSGGSIGGGGDLGFCGNEQGYELIWSVLESEFFHETIELTYTGRAGITFGFDSIVRETGTGYVWAINPDGANVTIRHHLWRNNTWGWWNDGAKKEGVYSSNKYHNLKLDINQRGVTTIIDGVVVDVCGIPNLVINNNEFTRRGKIGVRNDGSASLYKDIKHTDFTGEVPIVLADYSFDNGVNIFNGGSVVKEDGDYALKNGGAGDPRYWYDETSNEPLAVYALIEALPAADEITLADKTAVEAVSAAYETLSTFHKTCLPNYDKLEDAEIAIYCLENPGFTPAVFKTISLIDAIGEVTYRSVRPINAARKAYDALSAEEQAFVNNYAVLEAAELALVPAMSIAIEEYNPISGNNPDNGDPWSTNWGGNNYNWLKNPSADELQSVKDAFVAEAQRRLVMDGYKISDNNSVFYVGSWMQENFGYMVMPGGGDNVGKVIPEWGANHGIIASPFFGMAFSRIEHAADDCRWTNLVGNDFILNGKRYAPLWGQTGVYDTFGVDETDNSSPISWEWMVGLYPGSNDDNTDTTHNAFRYAYAKFNQENKWIGDYVGLLRGKTAIVDDVIYQVADSELGVKIIAANNTAVSALADDLKTPVGAYIVPNLLATAIETLGEGNIGAGLQITGAPIADAVDGTQEFENGTLTADGFTPNVPAELQLSIAISSKTEAASSGDTAKHDIVWKATVLVGGLSDETAYEAFNSSDINILEYGVFYGTSSTVVGKWADLDTDPTLASTLRKSVFGAVAEGETEIDMFASYGFRLRNCPKTAVRAAAFYVTYELNGITKTIISGIDAINEG